MAISGGEEEGAAEGKACTSPGSAVLVEALAASSSADRVAKP
jgi:hypothetical protein